ncbi:MAG: hypothetical protein Ta2F_18700 [Termitinemataceae bacterium]|nr:MAG: hypothetical protein Ta2F_18700 [Termitinemataceae bacterium]
MNVWVFNKPTVSQKAIDFIYSSLQNGISRYGWAWFDTADLEQLKKQILERNEQ